MTPKNPEWSQFHEEDMYFHEFEKSTIVDFHYDKVSGLYKVAKLKRPEVGLKNVIQNIEKGSTIEVITLQLSTKRSETVAIVPIRDVTDYYKDYEDSGNILAANSINLSASSSGELFVFLPVGPYDFLEKRVMGWRLHVREKSIERID